MAKELVIETPAKKVNVKFDKNCWVKGQLVTKGRLLLLTKEDAEDVFAAAKGHEAKAGEEDVEPVEDAPEKGGKKAEKGGKKAEKAPPEGEK